MLIERKKIEEKLMKKDYECKFCRKKITVNDVINKDYIYCRTSRGTEQFIHDSCLRRKRKNGDKTKTL